MEATDHRPGALFVINDLCVGGAERALISYVNHVRGVRPTVVLIRPALELARELDPSVGLATLGGTLPVDPRSRSVPVLESPRGKPRGRMLLETPGLALKVPRLVRLARERQSRVVSTFLNRSHTLALLAKALDPSLRVVINVHEMLSDHLDIHFAAGERRILQEFIERSFPRADAIVAVSEGVRDDLTTHFGIAPECITIVHNPIDLRRIREAAGEDPALPKDSRPLIAAVGRLVPLKGFDLLIRAVAELRERIDARLVIVGEGVARPELERLIGELGLADHVRLLGARQNPWAVLARARVVAVPSRSEAFPSVIGEALALSKPVVAARCSAGVAEYLEEGRCGLLVPPEDVSALASALTQILTDDALSARLAAAGPPRVEAFGIGAMVARYERVLTDVAEA